MRKAGYGITDQSDEGNIMGILAGTVLEQIGPISSTSICRETVTNPVWSNANSGYRNYIKP